MPTEDDDDITLTAILDQTKQVELAYDEYVASMKAVLEGRPPSGEDKDDEIVGIETVLEDLDKLINGVENSKDRNELLQYKSELFQIRSQIQTEMKDMKAEMKKNKQIASATEKAIKWNLGDIF
jgi:hypothetical protein